MRKNVLYIGTGAGVATFLCFADREYLRCKNKIASGSVQDNYKPEFETSKADLVFVSRDIEHMRWIAKYIEGVLTIPEMTRRMRFHIYITIKDKANSLASFLFWRAMFLYNIKKEDDKDHAKSLFINLGRPDYSSIIEKV
jgi:hypothetical protein